MSSNILPRDEAQNQSELFKRSIWDPIERRADIVIMTSEMPAGMDAPYTTNQLAHAMQFLTDHPEIVTGMEEVDHRVRAGQSPDNWDKQLEAEQKQTFNRLLDGVEQASVLNEEG